MAITLGTDTRLAELYKRILAGRARMKTLKEECLQRRASLAEYEDMRADLRNEVNELAKQMERETLHAGQQESEALGGE